MKPSLRSVVVCVSSCLVFGGCAGSSASAGSTTRSASEDLQTVHGEGFTYDIPASLGTERDQGGYVHHARDGGDLTITLVAGPEDIDLEVETRAALDRLASMGARVHYEGMFEREGMFAALGQAILDGPGKNLLVITTRTAGQAFLIECSDVFENADAMASTCMAVAASLRAAR